MLIYEFRVVLPMTVDEYQVAQLYSVAEASKNETGGGEGIEVLKNEPFTASTGDQPKDPLLGGKFTDGQYTHKIYRLASKVPSFIRWLAPAGSLEIFEDAWNAFPYCRTIVTNPEYMKDNFIIKIETLHLPDAGTTQNAHELGGEQLAKREVVHIDIANDHVDRKAHELPSSALRLREVVNIDIANDPVSTTDYKEEWDPQIYKSEKTGRGPLKGEWKDKVTPVMCCYKLVTVEFKWWGLQGKVEKFIQKTEKRIFTNFHRQVFCWTDKWYGLTMADIRALEEETKRALDEQIKSGEVRGTTGED